MKVLLALLLAIGASQLSAAGKSDLKVLYVGLSLETATAERLGYGNDETSRYWLDLRQSRTADFKAFLNKHFTNVDIVYSDDYIESMSANYQVTVFGDLPKVVKERVLEEDKVTGEIIYEPAKYLSTEFDYPAISIAEVSAGITEPLEYKFNWYCLCLDAHAHGMDPQHAIFNTPIKVELALEKRKTPSNYKAYYNGRNLPDSMAMWQVQKEGFSDGGSFPAGLVSTGFGFENAPDAEIISNGVNDKDVTAVALARHGNFFHWGFSASPKGMTEQGRQVFINAIHYIARFSGDKPYSLRPYRTNTRDTALNTAHAVFRADYQQYAAGVSDNFLRRQALLKRKSAKGDSLTFAEQRILKQQPPEPLGREEWLKSEVLTRLPQDVVALFGDDVDKYVPYYEENLEYLIPTAESKYQYVVDQDAKAWGLSNRKPEILDHAISLLEQGRDTDRARRVLARYTSEAHATAKAWRSWYNDGKGRFYFSDLDGYKFHLIPKSAGSSSR